MINRYKGWCHCCGKPVEAGAGHLELKQGSFRRRSRYVLWCMDCFNKSDNSGPEDRECGNRAYEDECARRCGL